MNGIYAGKIVGETDKWAKGFYSCVTDNYTPKNRCYITAFETLNNGEIVLTGQFEVIPETVREAVKGAFDKNHKQIFVKDIVRKGFELYCVDWDAEQLRYSFYTADGVAVSGFNVPTLPFVEVVGNTIDNPEILTKGQNL